ncbi:DUF397 domain-containing protein [Thermopolyspora sp. NPDC052614]|uniref:DUF397 domain-containing protein n=1 Tax=Thermopolyspora sp. NPDC052614 TaxID=3155682 RepID=UPI00343E95FA
MRPNPPATARWRKSSYSNEQGHCVEVAAWRKSSHSNAEGHCVEAASGPDAVAVRDSKNPNGPMLILTPAAWRAFLRSVRA